MKFNQLGQTLIFALVLLPVLIVTLGLLVRVGTVMLRQDQIENHCDKRVLDALAVEGEGLHDLGKFNNYSRITIKTRRFIDFALKYKLIPPPWIPVAITIRTALKLVQKLISLAQKASIAKTFVKANAILFGQFTPKNFRGKIIEHYGPLPLKLYVDNEDGYENDTGAPLEPGKDFEKKQNIWGHIQILTEKFVWPWQKQKKFDDIFLNCKAKITMKRLEDPWSAQLMTPDEVKPSWNAPSWGQ